MQKNKVCLFLGIFLFLTVGVQSAWALQYEDSWIFRSAVAPDQTMWGTSSAGYDYSGNFEKKSGSLGTFIGVNYHFKADPGMVSGNVQGSVTAKYDKIMKGLGPQTISLSYTGQDDESQISSNLGVKLWGNAYAGADWFWFGRKYTIGGQFFDINLGTKTDFTTGLDHTVSDSGRYDFLPLNVDLVLLSGDLNFFLDNDIFFTPKTISGTMKYVHFETGIEREVDVEFGADTDLLDLEVDLDLPGMWEFSLEDFSLSDNTFNQKIGPGIEVGVGVPILGAEIKFEADFGIDFGGGDFALDFLNHGDDGDSQTIDRLGRFCVYVDPVPIPGALLLFGSGMIGLIGLRRKTQCN